MKLRNLSLLLLAAACGGGDKNPPVVVDSNPTPDVPVRPPPPAGCDGAEFEDVTNDILFTEAGVPENLGVTFGGTTVICGKFDVGHFEPPAMAGQLGLLDSDVYNVEVGAESGALVTVSGAGLETLGQVQVLAIVEDADGLALVGRGDFIGSHGVFTATLPAGTIGFAAFAAADAAPAAAIDYKIRVTTDNAQARCARSTAAANGATGVTEGNAANDMVEVNPVANTDPTQTASAADNPDLTNHTASVGSSFRIVGTTANTNAPDEYFDPDTFEFSTGADIKQITIRLDWDGGASDHDFFLFPKVPAAAAIGEITSGTRISDTQGEFVTLAMLPNQTGDDALWVWTGAYDVREDNTTAPTLPRAYDITICGEDFVAP